MHECLRLRFVSFLTHVSSTESSAPFLHPLAMLRTLLVHLEPAPVVWRFLAARRACFFRVFRLSRGTPPFLPARCWSSKARVSRQTTKWRTTTSTSSTRPGKAFFAPARDRAGASLRSLVGCCTPARLCLMHACASSCGFSSSANTDLPIECTNHPVVRTLQESPRELHLVSDVFVPVRVRCGRQQHNDVCW